MPLNEITEQEVLDLLNKSNSMDSEEQEKTQAFLFFTPFCGTCALGERMLEIVQATGKSVPLSKVNINYTPRLRDEWQIESVPCLVVVRSGEVLRKEYAMRSVDYLYEILRTGRTEA